MTKKGKQDEQGVVAPGTYYIIVRSRQLNSSKVRYKVTVKRDKMITVEQ
ncbi:hypothetical protein [Dulcicalothrix desertica]|nr:hypothetical protein [Dulcicalothrix desertica]